MLKAFHIQNSLEHSKSWSGINHSVFTSIKVTLLIFFKSVQISKKCLLTWAKIFRNTWSTFFRSTSRFKILLKMCFIQSHTWIVIRQAMGIVLHFLKCLNQKRTSFLVRALKKCPNNFSMQALNYFHLVTTLIYTAVAS